LYGSGPVKQLYAIKSDQQLGGPTAKTGTRAISEFRTHKMKVLLTLLVLANLANAKAVDEWTFFSGAHLGMTVREYDNYYAPIADTFFTHSGAPAGERYVDFRSYGTDGTQHDWRVLVHYRESDATIVSVEYWNASGKFSKAMIRHLADLNKGYPDLITKLYDEGSDTEFVVTTRAQDKLEAEALGGK
jgi:hypothetical protein